MKNKIAYTVFLFLLVFNISSAQTYNVLHAEGESYIIRQENGREVFKKIVFGPLMGSPKIIIKEKASLRLSDSDNKMLVLSEPGEYELANMEFKVEKENSVFNKFCDYFHSFFGNHSSSESKSNYSNSIYAISRGSMPPPSLDFPLDGVLPSTAGQLPFVWTHSCEDCEYVINVYDYNTRIPVYAWTTKETSVMMDHPNDYLMPDKKYYWSVAISGEDLEYQNNVFSMGSKSDFNLIVANLLAEYNSSGIPQANSAETLYVMSDLMNQDKVNYAIYFGITKMNENPDDLVVKDIVERFWYDTLQARE